jgi:DNA-binding CsgD family transcriptional regulator
VPSDRLLDLIGEVHDSLRIEEFRPMLLDALAQAVPADWISLNDIGPDPESTAVLIKPPFEPSAHELFARLAHENPLISRFQRTLDGRAYRFSDVVSADELHALALYREFYGPLGLEYQIAFTLPHQPTRLLGVALSRRERDFSDSERDLLNRARPFLIQAYRNAIEHSELVRTLAASRSTPQRLPDPSSLSDALIVRGLTPRQAEIVHWIATGHSNLSVARALGISERTVQKHLQRCYRTLGVTTRSEAASLAWSLIEEGPPPPG